MGTIECSQPASKSSWDSQDFGDISMVLKMAHFRKSTGPRWVKMGNIMIDTWLNLKVGGLVEERRKSIANAVELRFSWTNPSIY